MPTPEYTKRAVNKYRSKFDLLQLRLPKGTKSRILALEKNPNAYIRELVLADLERLEKEGIKSTVMTWKHYPADYTAEELAAMTGGERWQAMKREEAWAELAALEAQKDKKL